MVILNNVPKFPLLKANKFPHINNKVKKYEKTCKKNIHNYSVTSHSTLLNTLSTSHSALANSHSSLQIYTSQSSNLKSTLSLYTAQTIKVPPGTYYVSLLFLFLFIHTMFSYFSLFTLVRRQHIHTFHFCSFTLHFSRQFYASSCTG